jgi:hypothetical protein
LFATFLAGIGLSSTAGLNAWLPLVILALADRFTDVIELDQPYDLLSSNWGIIILLLILPIELIADKIPRLDHLNDLLHTAFRPASGAILFMAVASEDNEIHPVLCLLLGLLIAGAVHWFKTTNRPAITVGTRGIGNPFISMIEDALVILVAALAIFVPWSMILVLPIAGFYLVRAYRRMRTGQTRIMALLGMQHTK